MHYPIVNYRQLFYIYAMSPTPTDNLTKAELMAKLVEEINQMQQLIIEKKNDKVETSHKKIIQLEQLIRAKITGTLYAGEENSSG